MNERYLITVYVSQCVCIQIAPFSMNSIVCLFNQWKEMILKGVLPWTGPPKKLEKLSGHEKIFSLSLSCEWNVFIRHCIYVWILICVGGLVQVTSNINSKSFESLKFKKSEKNHKFNVCNRRQERFMLAKNIHWCDFFYIHLKLKL